MMVLAAMIRMIGSIVPAGLQRWEGARGLQG